MPRFEPFVGLRYDRDVVDLGVVTAPPYDVIDEEERCRLEQSSPYNVVRIDLPREGLDRDRYAEARILLDQWCAEAVLVRDPEPAFYVYRMGFVDGAGRARQTAGVIGAMELMAPGTGGVLPHEHTMSKPKDDRLNLRRSCRADLSPIWGLSLADGLGALCELPGAPDGRCTDANGVHHRLWRVTQPGVLEAISTAVASTPVLIADGHHRYETALAHQSELNGPGAHDFVMTFVVELNDAQLTVGPIHRVLSGLPATVPFPDSLDPWFDITPVGVADPSITERMDEAAALGLVIGGDGWLLSPRTSVFEGVADLDSARLDAALAGLGSPGDLGYQHGADNVVSMAAKGEVDAAVLLRPATVAQIAATAHGGIRMPPKTTFFHPKPLTGMVFRPLG